MAQQLDVAKKLTDADLTDISSCIFCSRFYSLEMAKKCACTASLKVPLCRAAGTLLCPLISKSLDNLHVAEWMEVGFFFFL